MSLTLQTFLRSQEGQAMIATPQMFCLEGKMWQGFRGSVVEVEEKLATDAEIEKAVDLDGESKDIVKLARQIRIDADSRRLDEEKRKDRLEKLAEQERELQVEDLLAKRRERLKREAEEEAAFEAEAYRCKECDKQFDSAQSLAGHMVGAHRKRASTKG